MTHINSLELVTIKNAIREQIPDVILDLTTYRIISREQNLIFWPIISLTAKQRNEASLAVRASITLSAIDKTIVPVVKLSDEENVISIERSMDKNDTMIGRRLVKWCRQNFMHTETYTLDGNQVKFGRKGFLCNG